MLCALKAQLDVGDCQQGTLDYKYVLFQYELFYIKPISSNILFTKINGLLLAICVPLPLFIYLCMC